MGGDMGGTKLFEGVHWGFDYNCCRKFRSVAITHVFYSSFRGGWRALLTKIWWRGLKNSCDCEICKICMYKHVQFYILASRIPTEKLHVAWWFQRCIYEAGCRGELLQMRNREVSEGKAGPAVGEMIFPDWAGQPSSCSSSNSSCFCSCKSFKVSRCERKLFLQVWQQPLRAARNPEGLDTRRYQEEVSQTCTEVWYDLSGTESCRDSPTAGITRTKILTMRRLRRCSRRSTVPMLSWGSSWVDYDHEMKPLWIVGKNQLTNVFSDEKKRQLYDEYGSFGLYLADQVGWWLLIDCK